MSPEWFSEEETSERVKKSAEEVKDYLDNSAAETSRLVMRHRIGLAMNDRFEDKAKFDNPIIWMNFLRQIKVNTPENIRTVGDFVDYSHTAGDAQLARFNLINNGLKKVFGTDLRENDDFPWDTPFEDFINGTIQLGVYMDDEFKKGWQENEYKRVSDFPEEATTDGSEVA